MDKCKQRMFKLAERFKSSRSAFIALGDETRQLIIIALLESDHNGIRVGEITEKTHLSRPAVSHYLRILKNVGIINMRREGTKNYYYVNSDETQWRELKDLMNYIYEIVQDVNCSKNEEENF